MLLIRADNTPTPTTTSNVTTTTTTRPQQLYLRTLVVKERVDTTTRWSDEEKQEEAPHFARIKEKSRVSREENP